MFKLKVNKQSIITPLLTVAGAVDKKPNSAILGHILLKLAQNKLWMTATDLEIEITAAMSCEADIAQGSITVPAKKFVDIMRSLDDDAEPTLQFNNQTLLIKSGRSQFKLTTLPSNLYPATQDMVSDTPLTINRVELIHLLQSTCFAMSLQDVRIYLNGVLLEIDANHITSVAADGHRMAICRHPYVNANQHYRLLIPRKGVQEMLRLLQSATEETVTLHAGIRHIKIATSNYVFSSKLIDTRFPPYHQAIPSQNDKSVVVDRDQLKRALSRIIILANEKSRAVILHLQPNLLTVSTTNQEQEEAIESLTVTTTGEPIKIGINASYLLDVLQHLEEGAIRLSCASTSSSILVESTGPNRYQYIIMPMKL